ncbi:MAG: RdgB/HAM1 family non-canonical purine NTP pyrophosphatase [Pyrinomonadaceae bacterium]
MIHGPNLEILVATSNAGKIREIQQSLRDLSVKLRYLWEFDEISKVEEVGETYEENAILKAVSYSKQTGLCALADDSGLEVDALGGMPGVLSARYGGSHASDPERTKKLLTALAQRPRHERTARFACSLALAGWPLGESKASSDNPRVLHVCEGKCEGFIGEAPRGTNGFGYDPVFYPIGYDRTFAQLPSAVKNVISHRAHALAAMARFLNHCIG